MPEITDQISYKNLLESCYKLDVSFHKCTAGVRNRLRVQLNRDPMSLQVLWNLERLGYGRQVVS